MVACELLLVSPDANDFGQLIRTLRRQRRLKLVAVEKYIAVSTLNAIENGRMLPSTAMLDGITQAFDMPIGALDLAVLPLVRNDEQRTELVQRLMASDLHNDVEVQRALRMSAKRDDLPVAQRLHSVVELANLLARRGANRRAVWLMEHLLNLGELLTSRLRLAILSSLGRFYLHMAQPEEAIGVLLEAVRLRPHNDAWESAMCNLGLAWWLLGHYTKAANQWTRAADAVRHPERLGNAYFGLGSVFLRQNEFHVALQHYHHALAVYQQNAISVSHQIRALNNLLACQIRVKDWAATDQTLAQGNAIIHGCDEEYQGEWLATQAELAWMQGHRNDAMHLIARAKESLGPSLAMSWFTTRLIELRMLAPSTVEFSRAIEELNRRSESLTDRNLRTGLTLAVVRVLMQNGLIEEATTIIARLSETFPVIG